MDAVWINGELRPTVDATVSVFDHGLTVGDGVFETMKTVVDASGEPHAFALGRHLRRLRRSAAVLALDVPPPDDELRAAVAAVLVANPGAGRVRITVTGGIGPLGSDRGDHPPTVFIGSSPATPWPATTDVVVVPWRRNERSAVAGAKTTSYAENVVALAAAHERGASEALLCNTAGLLCEGTGSNVFVGREGRLLTPPLRSGCLAGITRELVLEVVDVVEADLTPDDLRTADEAFLTSSTRDVHPVRAVDGQPLPSAPGPLTAAAASAFAARAAASPDP